MPSTGVRLQTVLVSDDYDQYTMYRLLYHLDKFVYGWRNLLVFYLAMFIAGYAQVVNSWVFWGSWAALVLIYWEPYLSPPYPWSTDSSSEDSFDSSCVQPWGQRPAWLRPATYQTKQAMRQWLFATRQGLLKKQRRVHRLLQGLIAVPSICLAIGVAQKPPSDIKTLYSAALLLALVAVYTALTLTSYLAFHWGVRPRLKKVDCADLQPKDMMFFICKILGETLNTTVQTLVAGSFVAYMPTHLFWLCIAITAMSYTATNLLFELGPDAPVEDEEAQGGLWDRCSRSHTVHKGVGRREHDQGAGHMQARENSYITQSGDFELQLDIRNCDTGAAQSDNSPPFGTEAVDDVRESKADGGATEREPAVSVKNNTCEAVAGQHQERKSPPFLLYKWPKGTRGWSIIVLLMGVSGPSLAVLVMLAKGCYSNRPEWYFSDPYDSCTGSCFMRYQQMLFMLCCLGFLTSYYAATVGFLGAGPVTWLYKNFYLNHRSHSTQ